MNNAMSLKAKIRNIAKEKNIKAQVVLQNYMFERFLMRLSKTEYREKFVIKGGMLVSALVGMDLRSTMDLDTTLKNLSLTPESIRKPNFASHVGKIYQRFSIRKRYFLSTNYR